MLDCKWDGPMDQCPKGERCGLWFHHTDSKGSCVNERQCDTYGKLVTDMTKAEENSDWFSITCQTEESNWAMNAFKRHEEEVPGLGKIIQAIID